MPPHAKHRSAAAINARTTTIFIELDDPTFGYLLDNFPLHNHGELRWINMDLLQIITFGN